MPARSSTIIGVVVALAASLLGPFLAAGAATGPALDWISLVTGDQVAIDQAGSVVAVRPAVGRESIRVSVQRKGDHLYVVPADAVALIARGLVDRRLFDVALLDRPEYRRQNAEGLAIIVTYRDRGTKVLVRSADGVRLEHTYPSINGEALTLGAPGSAGAWRRLTAATGVKRVWLDAVPDSLYRKPHPE